MNLGVTRMRRDQLGWLFAAIIAFTWVAPAWARADENREQPNVVIFLADDQGWGDLSLHGNKDLSTPNIDSLARDGVMFDRFYACAVCAPTRAEFLTGRYHPRSGVHGVSRGAERMNLDESTIAEAFQAAGYATGCFGKWHNGMQYPYHPRARGFDTFVGYCSGHWGDYFDAELERNGEYFQSEGYITDVVTNEAIQFIEQNKDEPFFCYVPLPTPHSPMQVPDMYWDRFNDKKLVMDHRDDGKHTRAALAMVDPAHRGQAYHLTGEEAIDFHHVASILGQELGREIRYEPARVVPYLFHLIGEGLAVPQALVQTILHVGLRRGDGAPVTDQVRTLLGRPPRTVEEYVASNRETFLGS